MDAFRQQGNDLGPAASVRSRAAAPHPSVLPDRPLTPAPAGIDASVSPAGMLVMQRLVGNRAVRQAVAPRMAAASRTAAPAKETTASQAAPPVAAGQSESTGEMIELRPEGVVHPGAWLLDQPDVHGRLPRFKDLRAALTDPELKIPEAVIKDRVSELLGRMQAEKRLKSTDPIATIVAKIFPGGRRISEVEFNKAVDVADRTRIYQSVLDADTKVHKEDKAKLRAAMKDAEALISQVQGDAAGMTQVFGTKDAIAITRYAAARTALIQASAHLDTEISTDYNLDADQIGLGGYASFSAKKMHLLSSIVKVVDPNETKITLIHESSHLSSPDVQDKGYYEASDAFAGMTEDEKIGNAAHFEELPRRVLGTSSFVGRTFTPGQGQGGKPLTREDTVRRIANEYARKAWDAAVDCHLLLSEVRQGWLRTKSRAEFIRKRDRILEISKLIDLTIHTQAPAHARVTSLDVTLSESVAAVTSQLTDLVRAQPLPTGPFSNQGAADVMVAAATAAQGHLLGDPARDKAALDWLVAHVGAVFP